MSSFRVERQNVSFQSLAEPMHPADTRRPAPDAVPQDTRELEEKRAQAMQAEADARRHMEDAQREAEGLLETARKRAEEIAAQAERDAQKALEESRREGLEAGRREAVSEQETWKQQEEETLRQKEDELDRRYDERLDAIQNDLIDLTMEIAEKIIGVKLQESDEALLNIVGAALSRFRRSESVTVRVSGGDYRRLSGSEEFTKMTDESGKQVSLERDPKLHPGDCILETENELIDCGADGQLERLDGILREGGGEEEHGEDAAKMPGEAEEC